MINFSIVATAHCDWHWSTLTSVATRGEIRFSHENPVYSSSCLPLRKVQRTGRGRIARNTREGNSEGNRHPATRSGLPVLWQQAGHQYNNADTPVLPGGMGHEFSGKPRLRTRLKGRSRADSNTGGRLIVRGQCRAIESPPAAASCRPDPRR